MPFAALHCTRPFVSKAHLAARNADSLRQTAHCRVQLARRGLSAARPAWGVRRAELYDDNYLPSRPAPNCNGRQKSPSPPAPVQGLGPARGPHQPSGTGGRIVL